MKKIITLLTLNFVCFFGIAQVGYGPWANCIQTIGDYNPVTAANSGQGGSFGTKVSINGDYALISVAGGAYIYHFNGSTWDQQQFLACGVASSVCIFGNRAIIGQIVDVNGHHSQGKAIIYQLNNATWSQQAELTGRDGTAEDFFGVSVAIEGDNAIVGASYKNAQAGEAYIFHSTGSSWLQQQILTATTPQTSGLFGSGVAISGNRALVASFQQVTPTGSGSGAVFAFEYGQTRIPGSTVSWHYTQMITPPDGALGDVFGYGLAVSGTTAIIGAPQKKINSISRGKVYIYALGGRLNAWQYQDAFTVAESDFNEFGTTVGISGNYAIVSMERLTAISPPAPAYIFQNVGGMWRQYQKVTDPRGASVKNVAISDRRFVVTDPLLQNNTGIVIFGKILP